MILALDTSSAAGSAALVRDDRVLIERVGDGSRTHGQRLPRELMTLLADANLTLDAIDAFAICVGPGSFTGLRIGIATVQGLALAQAKLVTPVSSFEALAFVPPSVPSSALHPPSSVPSSTLRPPSSVPSSALRPPSSVPSSTLRPPSSAATGVWIDAHRGEVFATLYGPDGGVLHAATSLSPEATLDLWTAALADVPVRFAGDGAVKHAALIAARLGANAGIPADVPPLAGAIGLIATAHRERAVRPHAVVPLYVRRTDVELARERRQLADKG